VNCVLCGTPMGDAASSSEIQPMHRECSLRSVLGGIGHLLDHAHFCGERGDPDAGLSFRTSALLVDAWVAAVGVGEVASR
jgi:hypothetical protein